MLVKRLKREFERKSGRSLRSGDVLLVLSVLGRAVAVANGQVSHLKSYEGLDLSPPSKPLDSVAVRAPGPALGGVLDLVLARGLDLQVKRVHHSVTERTEVKRHLSSGPMSKAD